MHETRKTVTVLFADVVASTDLGERLDPEALRQVVSRYFAEMADVLERFGGTVEKFIGDEVMAVFGVPAVHEDDALRAVRAAEAMHRRLATLNEELEETWGARLAIRIGINTGEVMAGDPSAGHGFVTGSAVNVAKRLEQAARPGEVLLGDATHRLVRHAVHTTPIGPISLRGKREDEVPQRLEDVDPHEGAVSRDLDAPLVGRAEELARLRAAYERVVASRTPQLLALLGHAGIGKSRLARELLRDLGDEATALVGRCLPYGEGITFWPVREILPDESLEGTNDEIFWRIRKRLEALAAERPLVVCFEDLHWAEPSLLDLVQYLAGWTRDAPLLLLCLARPELLEQRPDLLAASSGAEALTLGPLAVDEASTLLELLSAPAPVRRAIAEGAEGNPLFLEQMSALAAEQGAEVTVPPSIRALMAARLDRLEPEETEVLECAAVAGREFTQRAVTHLVPSDLGSRTGAILLALARKELVRPRPRSEDGFEFWHGLIRDAAYHGMAKQRRADLHERHAAWLEAGGAEQVLVGYHLEQAALLRRGLGLRDERTAALAHRAGVLIGDAAARALGRQDVTAAQTLLRRALTLLPSSGALRLELERLMASTLWAVGEIERADALLSDVIDAAHEAGEPRTEWLARLDRAQRRAMTGTAPAGDLADVATEAVSAFEELSDDAGLARARRALAAGAFRAGRYERAQVESTRALEHARRARDVGEEARSADLLCSTLLFGPAEASSAASHCRKLLARSRGNLLLEANVTTSLAGLEAMRGAFDEARRLYGRARELFGELGMRMPLAGLTQISGQLELLAGDWAAAERELREGYEILVTANARSLLAPQAALLGSVLIRQGRHREAARLVAEAEEALGSGELTAQIVVLTARTHLALAHGDAVRAATAARGAVTTGEETDALNLRAEAYVALGLAERERGGDGSSTLQRAIALYERKGNLVAAEQTRALARRVSV